MSPEFSFVISRSSFLCLIGVGLIVLLLLGALVVYFAIDSFRSSAKSAPEHPWARLARENQLNFDYKTSFFGLIKTGPRVTGVYQSHYLHLALKAGKNDSHTRLDISANPSIINSLAGDFWPAGVPFTVDDLFALIAPGGLPASWRGTISIDPPGQWVVYRERLEEREEAYLQAIFDLACDVLEGYAQAIHLGGVVVPALTELATISHPLQQIAYQCLYHICQQTQEQLGQRTVDLLCPDCLVHPAERPIQIPRMNELGYLLFTQQGPFPIKSSRSLWKKQGYYGCRQCGQSQQFLEVEDRQVVVVLDEVATEFMIEQPGQLRVNWFAHPRPFDFDEVEIIQVDDEAVERFAVQLGNDTDPIRRPRYRRMRCRVATGCSLSANTIRILQHTFGEVREYVA